MNTDEELKKRFKIWCKSPSAFKGALELVDLYDEIVKRKVVFQSGQRCGDSMETGKDRLAEQGRKIIETYFNEQSNKNLKSLLSCPGNIDLEDQNAFEEISNKIAVVFEDQVKCTEVG
ncbi:hypothetical protein HK096_002084 [Nowakowskiella sp. JEL0078]|nr:hypothetical protein HK096_002084 [Nowakowskiella sp. JEL0078]